MHYVFLRTTYFFRRTSKRSFSFTVPAFNLYGSCMWYWSSVSSGNSAHASEWSNEKERGAAMSVSLGCTTFNQLLDLQAWENVQMWKSNLWNWKVCTPLPVQLPAKQTRAKILMWELAGRLTKGKRVTLQALQIEEQAFQSLTTRLPASSWSS